ncbi:unnamed protein product, partial [Rotaria sp. Silwood2]
LDQALKVEELRM